MKGLRLFFAEWGNILRNPKVLVPVIAVMMIPVMYSALFLGTFWDPYGKMKDLPVAIVNEDKGAELEGEKLTIGKELVDELKESKELDFHFVSSQEALAGLKEDRFYMTITIPEDFSKRAASLMDDEPKQAELLFQTNEGHNFLAAQIGGTAIHKVNSEISRTITESYTKLMFEQVEKVSEGLGEAGDGATKIHDGTKTLANGTAELKTNMAKLSDGALKLKQGTTPLADGAQKLNLGAAELNKGAASMNQGLKQLAQAHDQLEQGARKSEQGATQLQAGLKSSAAGSKELAEGTKALAGGLEQLVKASPELANHPAMKQIMQASRDVQVGASKLNEGQTKLVAGASALKDGQTQLVGGMKQFGQKLDEAAAGSGKLTVGAKQLADGAAQLKGGVTEATKAITTIADGSSKLNDGAGKLQNGVRELKDGSGELASKLNEAADEASSVQGSEKRIEMYAKPVTVVESSINKVPNYGTGFAPYFLSLGLFVGALILTIVLPLVQSPDPLASGWSRFVSKTLLFVSVGVVQALVADAILIFGLGLEVQNTAQFIGFSILSSMTYMFIIQSLVTVLGDPGRFVAIIILILQLVSCGGTFPIELTPTSMQVIGDWLPMTYTVNGFKAVISSGDTSMLLSQSGILAIYIVAFGALTLGYFVMKAREARSDQGALTAK
ncbi:YhgE/Pip family protein [Paenibacillus arenosi]|uniref:YhgE/Pip domain-containing protein n=1 Tax=Paenibacillus arenosi TaxID=2774142 RepID=A0ABR9AW34_9BACL|nr:YhgE/Pip domain-containing protein [Paenibacillus arenosi]